MEQQISNADTTRTRPGTLTRRTYLRHVRHRTIKDIDRRSRAGRRALQLIKRLMAEVGGEITDAQRMAVERAAVLQSIAEDALVRRLNGDDLISLKDAIALHHAAERAVRRLHHDCHKVAGPTLAEYL